MLNETIRKERPAASTGHKSNRIKVVESFIIVSFDVVIPTLVSLDHGVEVLGWRRYWPSFFCRFISFDLLPFIYAARDMDTDACRAELLSADVAYNCFWSLCVGHFAVSYLKFVNK